MPPNFFQHLTNLENLEVNNNPLMVIDQNTEISLGYLTNLQVNYYIYIIVLKAFIIIRKKIVGIGFK